jgi:hypothetical protein
MSIVTHSEPKIEKSPSVTLDEHHVDEASAKDDFFAEFPFGDDIFSDDESSSFRRDVWPDVPLLESLDEEFAEYCQIEKSDVPRASFDMSCLMEVVCKAVKQCSWTKVSLIGYGVRNKVYLVTFSKGEEVIARIPYSIVSPNRLKSEVGAMLYAKAKLDPEWARLIPTVFTWNSDSANAVGAPYIIMEKMKGSPLASLSRQMTFEQRLSVTIQLAHFTSALHGIGSEFHKIGGVYFEDDMFLLGPLVRRGEQIPPHEMFAGPWESAYKFFGDQIHQLLNLYQTNYYPKLDSLGKSQGDKHKRSPLLRRRSRSSCFKVGPTGEFTAQSRTHRLT